MRNIVVATLLMLGCALPLRGQTDRATLSGTVSDNSDSLISAARIKVRSIATGLEYDAVTNSAGVYIVNSLPVGQYTATIVANGFGKLAFEPFSLQVGERRVLNAKLSVSSVNTVLQVTANDDLKLTSAEVGGVVQGEQLNELPMDGRSFERLESQVPGPSMMPAALRIRFASPVSLRKTITFTSTVWMPQGSITSLRSWIFASSFQWKPSPSSKPAAPYTVPIKAARPEARLRS
jgi:Carboxypeptidase regulatory-like domain